MPGEEQWTKTNGEHVDPPMSRIQPGRPRTVRTRGPDEPRNQYRIRKGGVVMRCQRCKVIGHNVRTCPRIRTEAVNYRGQSSSEVQSAVDSESNPQSTFDTEPVAFNTLTTFLEFFTTFDTNTQNS
ncbi:uncharacterized protein LOC133851158 [Alnus glutinosa]|uniref:uncharacterized protein LOC133851158 n=1 Tax=Alnus glutinosa TaxID=3517 RepID=UPI002D772214|nr:uncharacterized protein LOC133851158 [Alnus glutinosa]